MLLLNNASNIFIPEVKVRGALVVLLVKLTNKLSPPKDMRAYGNEENK